MIVVSINYGRFTFIDIKNSKDEAGASNLIAKQLLHKVKTVRWQARISSNDETGKSRKGWEICTCHLFQCCDKTDQKSRQPSVLLPLYTVSKHKSREESSIKDAADDLKVMLTNLPNPNTLGQVKLLASLRLLDGYKNKYNALFRKADMLLKQKAAKVIKEQVQDLVLVKLSDCSCCIHQAKQQYDQAVKEKSLPPSYILTYDTVSWKHSQQCKPYFSISSAHGGHLQRNPYVLMLRMLMAV
ncbi:hypothetical protein EDD18DRAFT_1108369 [Armillaria luteobubalina]|uniref:Uncharacterized protein n=1 Tax=Armillaria luteobubalina TaxID=153913 RepID=A0AA39Q0K6_9AGAR|nr:hypothetical protein EDD18DRAFT_1108369 [Armillaria luteobubalina]